MLYTVCRIYIYKNNDKNGRSSARLLLAVCSFMFNVRTFARKQMSTFSRMFTHSFMFEDQETVRIKRYMYLRKLSPTITRMCHLLSLFAATWHCKPNLLSFTLSLKGYTELFRKNILALRKGFFSTNKIKSPAAASVQLPAGTSCQPCRHIR